MNSEKIKKYVPEGVKLEISGDLAIFETKISDIVSVAKELHTNKKLSLKCITATDERREGGCFKIWYVFGAPDIKMFIVPFVVLRDIEEFPSINEVVHAAWNYERKLKTFFGLDPVGHPDKRPIVMHENWPADLYPLRKDFGLSTRPPIAKGEYKFQKVEGEGIYEIPVGPIHAGIIEPGHFRFSVAGEEIVLLEPRLGFVHKGSEKLFEHLSLADKVRLAEKISGDSSFSHSLAFCMALEKLGNVSVPKRGSYLRVIYAELERLANHFGDIGAIMTDTGFNFGGAQGGRLRERIMQINERLIGSRFLRGVSVVGGVTKNIDEGNKHFLSSEMSILVKDFAEVIAVADGSVSLFNRLEGTGVITKEIVEEHGAMGVPARAVGLLYDVRADYPYAAYDELEVGEIATEETGDVNARFRVRIKEVYASMDIIQRALLKIPPGPITASSKKLEMKKNSLAISVVEGWRGEIVYFVATDAEGNISRVAPRDPSFINWSLLGKAGPGNVVPDFPLINKSFNLSYTGYDL